MRGTILSCCIAIGIVCFLSNIYAQQAESLSELILEALENNPSIQRAYHLWQAQQQRIGQAGSLPFPKASYTYFGKNVQTKVGPQEHKYGLSQEVPFPGKLGLKSRAQAKQADILEQRYEEEKRQIIQKVKFVYYDIFWVDQAIQITEEEKTILENLEKVAQRKYEANLTPQQDVLKVQVELSRLIDKLLLLNQNRKGLVAKMNSLLNRPKDMPLGRLIAQIQEFQYSLDELHLIAENSSQKLQAANLAIERAAYEESLARLDYLPDFTLGFEYIQVGDDYTALDNDGEDAWMGMIAVKLPIWLGKLGAQLKEKQASLQAQRQSYENVENSIVAEVEDLYFKIITLEDVVSLYETALIPQTEQSFQAAKTAFETGRVDFLNWLDAERVLLQTRLAYYKTIADYQKSIAYLEIVVGKDL